ncbi:MAG: hypothetical protein AB8C84_09660 [Oligoflexales bacterium]
MLRLIAYSLILFSSPAFSIDIPTHQWPRYIRNVRKYHHFSIQLASTQGVWRGHIGSLYGSFPSQGIAVMGGFQFHLPIAQKLSYFLGSSLGYHQERILHPYLTIPLSFHLPGATAGISLTLNPQWRIQSQVDYSLTRVNMQERDRRLAERSNEVKIRDAKIEFSLDTVSWANSFDYFFNLNQGVHVEVSQLWTWYQAPSGQTDQILSDTHISKKEIRYSFGLVHHIL